MDSKIDLANIIDSKHSLVPVIRGVVGSNIVKGTTCGKGLPPLQALFLNNEGQGGFDVLYYIDHLLTWLNGVLAVSSNLAMNLSGPS